MYAVTPTALTPATTTTYTYDYPRNPTDPSNYCESLGGYPIGFIFRVLCDIYIYDPGDSSATALAGVN
jgi:hypothetical protein